MMKDRDFSWFCMRSKLTELKLQYFLKYCKLTTFQVWMETFLALIIENHIFETTIDDRKGKILIACVEL